MGRRRGRGRQRASPLATGSLILVGGRSDEKLRHSQRSPRDEKQQPSSPSDAHTADSTLA
eukprot:CAMPEP_0177671418 /NCGR_PEP_ID=MMETSP0447-20121125/24694_1 /TAXON_ID=0 /ORGANISM="Stygamoeba regulata, Strain BSH-02190019" /LENGTH=59 /DNA_ID=CAMNT_0019178811 /DNA_START=63 /DNA_END=238 /DNA_ORIENTATION=-